MKKFGPVHILPYFILLIFFSSKIFPQSNLWQQTNGPNGGNIASMAFNSSAHIFVGTQGGGVFRSTDGGASWKQTSNGLSNYWIYAIAVLPNGKIVAGGSSLSISSDNGDSWNDANNGFPTSNQQVISIVFNSNTNSIFIGTINGIFRSTNDGVSWQAVNVGLAASCAYSFIFKDNYIFVGTEKGIRQSVDNGETWTKIESGLPIIDWTNNWWGDKRITLAKNSKGYIYATFQGFTSGRGLYRSTDNGQSRNQIQEQLPEFGWRGLICIGSNDQIYLKTWVQGIFRSTNDGQDWEKIYPLTKTWWDGNEACGIYTFGISPDGNMYFGTNGMGVYRYYSDNNWQLKDVGLSNTYVQSLAIDSKGTIFAGAQYKGFFKSANNGSTWDNITGSINFKNDNRSILTIPNSDVIFAGCDSGLFRSPNAGNTWNLVLPNINISSLAYKDQNNLFAGAYDGGIYRSVDGGSSWNPITSSGDKIFRVFTIIVNSAGHIFAGTFGGGVFRSTNNGNTWENVGNKNTGMIITEVRGLAINSKGTIFAGTWGGGVYRSTDNGTSWINPLKDQGPNCNFINATVQSITIDQYDQIYVGTNQWCGTGIYISKDNAESWNGLYPNFPDWNNRDKGLTRKDLYALVCDSKGNLFAGTNGCGVSFCDKPALWICQWPYPNSDTRRELKFEARKNEGLPATQLYYIYNTGVGKVNWTASSNQSWVDVSPSSGNGDDSITVRINTTNLDPGTRSANITVTSNNAVNSPQSFTVTYTVNLKPAIGLSTGDLSFFATQYSPTPPSQSFNIWNSSGGGTLYWNISTNVNWLSLSAANGSDNGTISVSVNTTNMDAGTYPAIITINSNDASNNPQKINVSYTVSSLPKISTSNSNILFNASYRGPIPACQTFDINNSGGGNLRWSINANATWLNLTPPNGVDKQTVKVCPNTTNLAAGSYSAVITISDPNAINNPQTVNVTYEIGQSPTIVVNPTILTFTALQNDNTLPQSQTFYIKNDGSGSLDWVISNIPSWLNLSTTSGSSPSGTNGTLVTASTNTTNLNPGVYTPNLTITSTYASNSPQTISVVYTINQKPKIRKDKDSLTFSAIEGLTLPASQIFEIDNSGGGDLNWNISCDGSWLDINSTSGTNDKVITLNVNTTKLTPKTYTATITITSQNASNSPQTINITYKVLSKPAIVIDSTSMSFSAIQNDQVPQAQKFTIKNTGESDLNWTLKTDSQWIDLSTSSGINSGTIIVSINRTDLPHGQYTGNITISDPNASNSPQKIKITYVIHQRPTIVLNPRQLSFAVFFNDPLPPAQTFSIDNGAAGNLIWTLSNDADWLEVLPIGGTNHGSITTKIKNTNMDAGDYSATIIITSPGASNNPQAVVVSYTIKQKPMIRCDSILTFSATQNETLPLNQILQISNSGGGTLKWNISNDASWLNMKPDSGVNSVPVVININSTNLQPGNFFANIKINAEGASNSPQNVKIIYRVLQKSKIELNVDSLSFSSIQNVTIPATRNITIKNAGEAPLKWNITNNDKWLVLSPMSGINDSAISTNVTVNINMTNINPGTYHSTVKIESPGATNTPQNIPVSFSLTQQALIVLDKSSLVFKAKELGALSSEQTFTISNGGGDIFNWTITKDEQWLDVSPVSGSNDGTIKVKPNSTNMISGMYKATITITVPNAYNTPLPMSVSYYLEPPIEAAVSPNPFVPSKGHTNITFFGFMLPNSSIKIFSSSGKLIRTIAESKNETRLVWDCKNDKGEDLLSGIYLWVLTSRTSQVSKGKLAIIR